MYNPLRRYSRLVPVPQDLSAVTDIGPETPETAVGLRPGSVDALWSRVTALYATGVQPGMQLCVRHRGQVVLDRAIGNLRVAPGAADAAPLATTSPVNLFSAGKAVTAMLMHKLAELGCLHLDDPVAAHISGFERHGKGKIRIRQLLAHRAALHRMPIGLADDFDLGLLGDADTVRELILELKPQGKIGGAPAYHALTAGFVLGEIMRQSSGQAPQELLKQHIKTPLNMRWLDFGVDAAQQALIAENAATGVMPGPLAWHMQRIVGAPFDFAVEMSNDPRFLTALIPAANVISTARDISRLYQCLLDAGQHQGQAVFDAETVRQALTPDRRRPSIDRKIGIPIRYSAGFMLGHAGLGLYGWNRHHTFGHLGLSNTLTWARSDTQTCVALLATGKPVLGPHLAQLLRLFSGLNAFCENRIA